MRQKIKKGDEFLCTEDFKMNDGSIAFIKGKIYKSEFDDCLTDSWGINDHYMNTCDIFSDHFKSIDKVLDSKVLLQRILDLKNEH